jgi:hypothetical protein
MSLTLTRYRIRMAANALDHTPMACKIQLSQPKIWRGTDVQIEIALFWGETLTDTITNIANLRLDIHEGDARAGAPLVSKTLAYASLLNSLTLEQWAGGTAEKAHGVFTLTRLETNFDMTGHTQNKKQFWLVVHAETTAGYYTTYGATNLEVEEDGAQIGLATLNPGAYSFQIQNTDNPAYTHTVRVRGPVDNPQLEVLPGVPL